MEPKSPSFLIVGALKAGTTTLTDELVKHPEIGVPVKELHFFNANYEKGLAWYEQQFGRCSERIVGEATPTYGYHPHVPKIIKRDYPNVKIIWILRDPVYRAYSNYVHVKKHFIETRSFKQAIEAELGCRESNLWRLYCDRSRYADQIYRYMSYFPKEQIHIVILEELIKDFSANYRRVLSFLGVQNEEFLPAAIEQGNKTYVPKGLKLQKIAKKVLPMKLLPPSVRSLWPRQELEKLVDPQLIALLSDYFIEPNKQLEKLLGRSITCWKTFDCATRANK